MNQLTNRPTARTTKWKPRRGIAMLLVLVALGVGVVLAGVALTSRQPAARIGENACDDAGARWGAFAAANYAQAVLETSIDCVDHAGMNMGDFIKTFPIDGGSASVRLTRFDGSTPQPGDRELLMTAVATVGSMTATVQKRVSLANPVPMAVAADVRLGEFAVFAGTSLTIEKDAVIAPSPAAIEEDTLTPIKIGTGFSGSAAFSVDSDAELENAALYIDNNASASMDSLLSRNDFSGGSRVPYAIPLVRETQRPEVGTLPLIAINLAAINGLAASQTLLGGNYLNLTVRGGAVVTLGIAGQKTVYKVANITVEGTGVLRFEGEVIVQASGATIVRTNGAIEPADDAATIEFYLGRNVTLDNCTVGLPRAFAADNSRKPGDVTSHPKADQVFLSTLNTSSGGSAAPVWLIDNKSLVVASIHAPQSTLTIDGVSALFGRATCGGFTLKMDCFLYYDPLLDCRAGFTELNGPLYQGLLPIPEVTTLLASVSSAAGAQTFQDNLKDTLVTFWAGEPGGHPLIQPPGAVAPLGEIPLFDDETVIVDNSGNAQTRVKGKAKSKHKATRAAGYED